MDAFLLGHAIHKNEQLLDWPFTRLLLGSLYIKTSNYLWVKDHGLWTEQFIVLTWELASHNKQQVLFKTKGYVYVF